MNIYMCVCVLYMCTRIELAYRLYLLRLKLGQVGQNML